MVCQVLSLHRSNETRLMLRVLQCASLFAYQISPDGTVTTIAGTGEQASGLFDGMTSTYAISHPYALAVDEQRGQLYFTQQHGVRCVTLPHRIAAQLRQSPAKSSYARDMLSLLESSTFSNVTFIASGERIKAHQGILAIRCAHFKRLFEAQSGKASTMEFEVDCPAYAFRKTLEYLYTDVLDTTDDLVVGDVLAIAQTYKLDYLKQLCEEHLHRNIDLSNVLTRLVIADAQQADILRRACIRFIICNLKAVRQLSEFKNLRSTLMLEIIEQVPLLYS